MHTGYSEQLSLNNNNIGNNYFSYHFINTYLHSWYCTKHFICINLPTFLNKCSREVLVAQMVKRLPTTWETRIRSLGWEDRLEKEMATHPSILAWRIPWTEEAGGLQSMGSQESDTTE